MPEAMTRVRRDIPVHPHHHGGNMAPVPARTLWVLLASALTLATGGPAAQVLPVARVLQEVDVGQGEPLALGDPNEARYRLWWGDFEGEAMNRGYLQAHGAVGSDSRPGLGTALLGMRVGGVSRIAMPIGEFYRDLELRYRKLPTMGDLYVEVVLDRI
jgi:hypothetical protein